MAIDRDNSPYRRGNHYEQMPLPMVREHCIDVDAGAVQLVIESRRLTNAIIAESYPDQVPTGTAFNDYGATLHVVGSGDGLEYLRFDCFEQEPHYHYLHHAAGGNTVVRIDELAVGDPIGFSLSCVEYHLPDMLGNCGVPELAEQVKSQLGDLHRAMPEARDLMLRAQQLIS